MKHALLLVALCAAVALPVAAAAQAPTALPTPTADMRALMDKVHAQAKAAAYAAITPTHATDVSAIVAQLVAGKIDSRAAVEKIDGFLTGDEQKAVMTAAMRTHQMLFGALQGAVGMPMMGGPGAHFGPPGMGERGMRPVPPMGAGGAVAMASPVPGSSPMAAPGMMGPGMMHGPGMGGPGMHGPGGPGGRHHGMHGHRHLSAGRYLVMLSLTPEQMRAAMPKPRVSPTP